MAKKVDARWVRHALRGLDQLSAGARRNLNRQLGLDALAADAPDDATILGFVRDAFVAQREFVAAHDLVMKAVRTWIEANPGR